MKKTIFKYINGALAFIFGTFVYSLLKIKCGYDSDQIMNIIIGVMFLCLFTSLEALRKLPEDESLGLPNVATFLMGILIQYHADVTNHYHSLFFDS